MITVLTWLWMQEGGRTSYTAAHVNIWADMVRRHLKMPHRLACVTDLPDGIDSRVEIIVPPREFEDIRIPTWKEARPQCLRRLTMFAPDAARTFGERFVCMDMDCVVSGPLDPLFNTATDFKIFAGTAANRPYNGSMMLLRAGARPHVYTDFTPERAVEAGQRFVGSDQAWISRCLGPDEAVWTEADGVFWWQGAGQVPEAPRVLFFPGSTKPWEMLEHPYVGGNYRRNGGRRALILGRGASVWDEAEQALDRWSFDGVIALREPAAHWPGEIEAVADNEKHALRLATMLGFARFTFCGQSLTAVSGLRARA